MGLSVTQWTVSVAGAVVQAQKLRLNGFLAKYLCRPGLAQETYSTIPVGAINRVDNEGDRDPSNRTGTQHLPYTLSSTLCKRTTLS